MKKAFVIETCGICCCLLLGSCNFLSRGVSTSTITNSSPTIEPSSNPEPAVSPDPTATPDPSSSPEATSVNPETSSSPSPTPSPSSSISPSPSPSPSASPTPLTPDDTLTSIPLNTDRWVLFNSSDLQSAALGMSGGFLRFYDNTFSSWAWSSIESKFKITDAVFAANVEAHIATPSSGGGINFGVNFDADNVAQIFLGQNELRYVTCVPGLCTNGSSHTGLGDTMALRIERTATQIVFKYDNTGGGYVTIGAVNLNALNATFANASPTVLIFFVKSQGAGTIDIDASQFSVNGAGFVFP